MEYLIAVFFLALTAVAGYRPVAKLVRCNMMTASSALDGDAASECGDAAPATAPSAAKSGATPAAVGSGPAAGVVCVGGICTTPGNCFVAGTLVVTAAGPQTIESIVPGTSVLASDGEGNAAWKPVLRTFLRPTAQLLRLETDDDEALELTPDHRLFVAGRGWTVAREIVPGRDSLVDRDGASVAVRSGESIARDTTVFNLEVADLHSYFVGPRQLLAHNECSDDSGGKTTAATALAAQRLLPPAAEPTDPLVPWHAQPRAQRMQPPKPIDDDGKRYDVMGVSDTGAVRLRPEAVNVRYAPDTALVGKDVTFDGKSYRFERFVSSGWGGGEDGFQLFNPQRPSDKIVVPPAQASGIVLTFPGDKQYHFDDWPQHGVVRLIPDAPAAETVRPLRPGETFQARLVDHELEGPYTITVGGDGKLSAAGTSRSGAPVNMPVEPRQIAPRYVDVYSPDFKSHFPVDAFTHREATVRSTAITTPSAQLPISDPSIGSMPPSATPQVTRAGETFDQVAGFIRSKISPSSGQSDRPRDIDAFNIGFNDNGDGARVVDALIDYRKANPDARIRIISYDFSFKTNPSAGALAERLGRNNIELAFYPETTARKVIHAKGIVVDDEVMFSTAAIIPNTSRKADINVVASKEVTSDFRAYLDEAAVPATSRASRLPTATNERRQELAAKLAARGVLINDPTARIPYIARATDGLIQGAKQNLRISMSELREPEATRKIIARAQEGVDVDLQYRDIDPESLRLLEAAQKTNSNLHIEDVSSWTPRPHYNLVIADNKQAYFGTAYLWPNQLVMVHHGRSFESGVILQGQSVVQLEQQLDTLAQSARPKETSPPTAVPPVVEQPRLPPAAHPIADR